MSHILIATLSTEPQAITRSLDWLLQHGYPIQEVAVVHTSGEVIRPAWVRLDEEFQSGAYPAIRYKRVVVTAPGERQVEDILSEADAGAFLQVMYRTIRAARQAGQTVHLSITSGRKTMAAYAMTAAQLLFGEDDRVWHLVSTEKWSGREKMMHAESEAEAQMVNVPVLRWTEAATAAAILETEDPWEAIQRQQTLVHGEAARRQREFWRLYLRSDALREVAELLAREGLDNAALARRLGKSEQTIANQLTKIYRAFDEWRGFPAGGNAGCRGKFIATFKPYLKAQPQEEKVTTKKRKRR